MTFENIVEKEAIALIKQVSIINMCKAKQKRILTSALSLIQTTFETYSTYENFVGKGKVTLKIFLLYQNYNSPF